MFIGNKPQIKPIEEEELQEIIGKVGHPRGYKRKRPIDVEKVRAMFAAGFSYTQVGEYFGVCDMTIRRRLEDQAAQDRLNRSKA